MVKHIHEQIIAEEQEFTCLLCEIDFLQVKSSEPVCPKCGAKGTDVIERVKDREEEEYEVERK